MKAFISYSHHDQAVLERLHVHLAMLRREGLIDEWYDREILAGGDIDDDVQAHLSDAQLFVAIVSPDFLNSNYCYEKEMQRALERAEAGALRIVPVIAQPCEWKRSSLSRYKAVPKDGKPISEWTNINNAFLDIVTELRRVVEADATTPPVPSSRQAPAMSKGRYRIKRTFDEIDRADFRDRAFDSIRTYFKNAVEEIDAVEGVRARFRDLNATSFTCTVLNRLRDRGVGYVTVHKGGGRRHGMGDISYSFAENSPPDTANGWMSVEADDYELHLKSNNFSGSREDDRVSPEEAAKNLWEELLTQAGIATND